MSQSLARDFDAQLLDWDGLSHDVQETRLREAYQTANVVISNRLHVLVAAYTHGAVPVGLLTDESDKIERHFRAAGVRDISVNAAALDAEAVCRAIEAVTANRDAILGALPRARADLSEVRSWVVRFLSGGLGDFANAEA
jgi:hypothetical protein